MTSRAGNFPPAVLAHADALAKYHHVSRRDILRAACRAVVRHPPTAPVAYPTLDVAVSRVSVPMPDDVRAAVVIVERSWFYGRFAWLCFYGMVRLSQDVAGLLHMSPEALALRDAAAYAALSPNGGQPCPLPPTARAPVQPRPRRKRSR